MLSFAGFNRFKMWRFIVFLTLLFGMVYPSSAFSQENENLVHTVANGESGGAKILWSVQCKDLECPDSLVIRYARLLNQSASATNWTYTKAFSSSKASYQLEELSGDAGYIYQLGFKPTGTSENAQQLSPDEFYWSEKVTFRTNRPWGIIRALILIGSLGLFIYGMKTMSEGVQNAAGRRVQKILLAMTSNRLAGILSGFTLTGLIQSSTATTVMTVSFVNAGLLSLAQAAMVILGANVGTTITGWLVSLVGFQFKISDYGLVLLAFSVPMLFFRSNIWRSAGQALAGFALLIMGLNFLKDSVPQLDESFFLVQTFADYSAIPILGALLFIVLGALTTIIVQSSSAAMALTLTLCATDVLPIEAGAAMILGENIGTTVTAEVASLVGNVHAKRAARIHTLFNILGVIWAVLLLPFMLQLIGYIMVELGFTNPLSDTPSGRQTATTALAAFHSMFNLVNMLLFVWLIPVLVALARKTVRSRGDSDEEYRLEFIDTPIHTAEMSLIEARRQVAKYGEITRRMSGFVRELIFEPQPDEQQKLQERIKKYEVITDNLEVEVSKYLRKAATTELSDDASEEVRSMLSIISDLERIGDIFYQMSRTIGRKNEEKIWFLPEQRANIRELLEVVDEALDLMLDNLKKENRDQVNYEAANRLEKTINAKRNVLRQEYMKKIESGKYNLKSGIVYNELFSSLEKVGDHIINVSEALVGKI